MFAGLSTLISSLTILATASNNSSSQNISTPVVLLIAGIILALFGCALLIYAWTLVPSVPRPVNGGEPAEAQPSIMSRILTILRDNRVDILVITEIFKSVAAIVIAIAFVAIALHFCL